MPFNNRLLRDSAPRFGQLRNVDHQRATLRARGDADGIASARFPNRRNVNGGSAVAANDVRTILAISGGAANQAGVKRGAPASVWLSNHEEAQARPARVHAVNMKIRIADLGNWNSHRPAFGLDGSG